jgi:TMEM175 potassium channel family protein
VRTDRLQAFSDGVFAIAITLLALELPRPEGPDLWRELAHAWQSYAAFLVSFLTIGIIWVNHHALVDRIARADRTLLFLNLFLLMWVSIIPWPTGLVADRLGKDGAEAAIVVYSGVFLAMAITFRGVWVHARNAGVLGSLSPVQIAHLDRRNAVGLTCYLVAVILGFLVPAASLLLCFFVAAFFLLPDRADQLT